jgi:hypothetical protein
LDPIPGVPCVGASGVRVGRSPRGAKRNKACPNHDGDIGNVEYTAVLAGRGKSAPRLKKPPVFSV